MRYQKFCSFYEFMNRTKELEVSDNSAYLVVNLSAGMNVALNILPADRKTKHWVAEVFTEPPC